MIGFICFRARFTYVLNTFSFRSQAARLYFDFASWVFSVDVLENVMLVTSDSFAVVLLDVFCSNCKLFCEGDLRKRQMLHHSGDDAKFDT